jgi:hypothetical protein
MESFGIILNLDRPDAKLTPSDLALLREMIRLALGYKKEDQSFRWN